MGVSVDGLFSGIDTTSLISAVVEAISAPKATYEAQISDLEDRKEKLSSLVSKIGDLEDSLTDMETSSDFRSLSASYTDNDAFSASVTGAAVEGVYSIEVSSVATSEMEVSQGFADSDATGVLATGTMTLEYGGDTTSITVDSGTTLTDLASTIDDIDGVTAYIMNTGDATSPYRLVVQGDDTGSDYGITMDTSGLTGAGTVPSFTEKSTADDASLSINGVSVTSASNTVSGVIPGLTVDVTDVTSSAVDVTVSLDPDGIEEKVQAFVDAYNTVAEYIDTQSVYNADEDIRGAFVGESGVRRVDQGLRAALTQSFSDLGQDYDSLSLIGVSTDGSGTLEFDTDAFEAVLADHPDQVTELFTGSGGVVDTLLDAIDVYIDPYEGTLETRQDTIDDRIDDLNDAVDREELRISNYEQRLREQFTSMEVTLSEMSSSSSYLSAMLSSSSSSS